MYTEDDLKKVHAMLLGKHQKVRMSDGSELVYRSMDDLLKLKDEIIEELNASKLKRKFVGRYRGL